MANNINKEIVYKEIIIDYVLCELSIFYSCRMWFDM